MERFLCRTAPTRGYPARLTGAPHRPLAARGIVLLVLCALLASCSFAGRAGQDSDELIIFAAASLTDAFSELATAFEAAHPDVRVVLNTAGSSQLAAQLREGGVADIFAPANPAQMAAVVETGRIAPDAPVAFVTNRLTVIVPADNPAGIIAFADLARPDVQLILAVKGVPVRAYTDSLLAPMPADFQERFYANVVSEEENVRQVAAKIALGEADAAIVYASDIVPTLANQVQQIGIPDAQNVVATYPVAALVDAPRPDLAQEFITFILSPEGQRILTRWGFAPPAH